MYDCLPRSPRRLRSPREVSTACSATSPASWARRSTDLPRAEKQRAVRMLEERGAFAYRRSAETVAEAIGVTRFTVYNYLNRTAR